MRAREWIDERLILNELAQEAREIKRML